MNTIVQRHQGTVTITLPIRTVSEANQREHWAVKAKRKRQQQWIVLHTLGAQLWREPMFARAFHVTLTRVVPPRGRRMDQDNYAGSWKHVQDAVAKSLGVDDGDVSRVSWVYGPQERGTDYAVRIEVRQATGGLKGYPPYPPSSSWHASGRAKEKVSPVGSRVSVPEPRDAGRRPKAAPAHPLRLLLEDSKENSPGFVGVFGVSEPKRPQPKVYDRQNDPNPRFTIAKTTPTQGLRSVERPPTQGLRWGVLAMAGGTSTLASAWLSDRFELVRRGSFAGGDPPLQNGWLTAKSRHTTMPLAMGFWATKDDAVQASTKVTGPAGIEMTAIEMTGGSGE